MKNLKLYSELTFDLQLQSTEEVLLFSAFDIERNRLFFASSANVIYTTQIPISQGKQWRKTTIALEDELVDLEPGDCTTALDYLMEKEALIVGTTDGYLLLHTGDGKTTEVVGRVEGGVKSITPSPDGALLAVITGFGRLLVMTHDWELLYETTLEEPPEDFDVKQLEIIHLKVPFLGEVMGNILLLQVKSTTLPCIENLKFGNGIQGHCMQLQN